MILERQLMRLKYHLPQQKEKKMSSKRYSWSAAVLLIMMLVWGCCTGASAEGLSNEQLTVISWNIDRGLQKYAAEFTLGTTECEVKVPAGTQKLELDPVPSHEGAWIVSITGTELTDGKATVEILVSAESGEQYPYYLHVTADGSAAQVQLLSLRQRRRHSSRQKRSLRLSRRRKIRVM